MNNNESLIILAIYLGMMMLVAGSILIGASLAVAVQGRRRGYQMWLWFIACVLSVNPVIFIVVLALMPNRARSRRRQEFQADLQEKLAVLANRGGRNRPLAPTPLTGAHASERSLGDMPTMAPPERSIGDEMTRG